MKLNNEHLKKISNDISELYVFYHVYNSFMEHFYTDKYHSSIPNEEINILIFLRNSILHSFFVICRRLLSTGRGEASLANYYKETHQLVIERGDNNDESIFKSCLPNHYEKWQLLKKYIKITIQDLKLLLDDIELTYNKIAAKIEAEEEALDLSNAKCLADRLFTRWTTNTKG